ncbi:MAG: hypothetical protein OEY14_07845, partial [Myxococcales bacterium]|nr:hypothetical protein [Myxococcales bacterium]
MGSDLYSIRVLEKDDRMVSLHVRCVHPDVLYVAADPGFALLALLDAVPYRETAPLSDEVSFDDAMSGVWASQYARGFVKEVCARDVRDPLPAEAEEDDEHPYWESEQWLSWTLDVEVAHPAWIEHVHKGGCWDSTAFSPVGDYAEHAPIEPTPDAPMEDPEGMFVWVPRECYAETAQWWSELPPLLEMPAYS